MLFRKKNRLRFRTMLKNAVIVLSMVGVAGSCSSNSSDIHPDLKEQIRIGGNRIAYTRPGEQLYYSDITVDSDSKSIISFMPSGASNGEWPRITFEMEKDKLILRGGIISDARPVDEFGQNKAFYSKLKDLLKNDNIDMPTPNFKQEQYIYNINGLVREIISNPTNILYKKEFWILANDTDDGVAVYLHNRKGEIQESFIPGQGYLVIPGKVVGSILRIDFGFSTIFPEQREQAGVQTALDRFSTVRLKYKDFTQSNIVVKVFRTLDNGGTITITQKKDTMKFHLSPNQMIIYPERATTATSIELENVVEYINSVLLM